LILYDLLIGSVITAAFVPVFVQLTRDETHLWRIVGSILTLALLALSGIAVLLAVFAEPLIAVLAGGFREEQRELSVALMRVALVSVVFQGLAGVLTSVLYAQGRFVLPAFAVATFNLGVIAGMVLFAEAMGVGALVLGLILGALAQMLLQAAGLRSFWRVYRPSIHLSDPATRRVLALYGPVAAGMLVTVAGYFIDRNLASRLPDGHMTAMQAATTLIQFPIGLVGIAASYAVLPTLSRFGKGIEENLAEYRATLVFGLKLILLLMLPALAGLLALAEPVVRLMFQRGAFTPDDAAVTATIFLAYAPQLPFTAIDNLLIVAFYARQNTRTPVLVGVVATARYLVVALALLEPLGAVGLALADATKNTAHGLILLALLQRALPGLGLGAAMGPFLARVIPAAGTMGLLVWLAWSQAMGPYLPLLVGVPLEVLLGAVVYGVLLRVLGVPEAATALALATRRLRGSSTRETGT
jgi:putative peptidoglycan lipid II flippase